jgi:hypothetical protein
VFDAVVARRGMVLGPGLASRRGRAHHKHRPLRTLCLQCTRICASVAHAFAAAPSDASLASTCPSGAAPASSRGVVAAGTPIAALTRADDAAAAVDLPFAVSMYGRRYTAVTVSSNGWVALGAEGSAAHEPCSAEGAWPNAPCLGSGPVLAPLWGEWLRRGRSRMVARAPGGIRGPSSSATCDALRMPCQAPGTVCFAACSAAARAPQMTWLPTRCSHTTTAAVAPSSSSGPT